MSGEGYCSRFEECLRKNRWQTHKSKERAAKKRAAAYGTRVKEE
jgi:hypothetical protein